MKFIFYDTEATGTDTTFDQILQFAAILYASKMPAVVDPRLLPDLQAATGLPLAEIIRRAAVVSADGLCGVGGLGCNGKALLALRARPGDPAPYLYEGFPTE